MKSSLTNVKAGLLLAALALLPGWVLADEAPQQQSALEAAYDRADLIQANEHYGVFRNLVIYPRWIDDNRFWYSRETDDGQEFVIVDAASGKSSLAFDHSRVQKALKRAIADLQESKAGDAGENQQQDEPAHITLRGMDLDEAPNTARFTAGGHHWVYDIRRNRLEKDETPPPNPGWLVSPDGKKALYSKDNNLWMHDTVSGEDKALTSDGIAFYAYGAVPDATGRPAVKPEAVWSPDSKRVLTIQTDDRQVKDLPVINFAPEDGSVRPTPFARRTALPGDENIPLFRILSIDVESGKQTRVDHRDVPAVRMNDTPMGGNRAWWAAGSKLAYFVDIDRGERRARVIEFDTDTGRTRTVFAEETETYLELGSNVYMPSSIAPLPETSELIWYSERSGWPHFYLYDLATGQLKRQLTEGEWLVRDLLGVDSDSRQLYFTLAGHDPAQDPYDRSVARVNLDTGAMEILSSGDGDHAVADPKDFSLLILQFRGENIEPIRGLSPGMDYFVETVSRIDALPETILRDSSGKLISVLEKATAPGLPEGFVFPERVQLTAADGSTPISGVVFRPTGFDPNQSYPVIDYIYGGPQVSNVPESFNSMAFPAAQSLAELGFVTVVIDGRGTTERSREFHEASYGAAETASSVADHVAGIQQLAQRYPYMDVNRVGIYGFSGGGYMTAIAMLLFPDFFKVGVAGAGNFDQRLFWNTWGERYQGLLDGDNYLQQAALTHAKNLKGKLLFIHGMVDYGVHPGGLFQLTQALMDANKKFEMVLMPRAGHELPGYAMVRMWDFFVKHLAGKEPPEDYSAKSSSDYFREEAMALAAEAAAAQNK